MKNSWLFIISLLFFALNNSATAQTQWIYSSPSPNSKWINPEQTLAFRNDEALSIKSLDASLLELIGTKSGAIKCSVSLSSDRKTVIYTPAKPFAYGETIDVFLESGIISKNGKIIDPISFSFQIKERENLSLLSHYYQKEAKEEIPFIQNIPATTNTQESANQLITYGDYHDPERYMVPTVTTLNNPDPGYTFATPRPRGPIPYDPYNVILDKYGVPVFFLEWNTVTNLFQKVPNNQLTFCSFSNSNPASNRWYVLNDHYVFTDTLTMGNGYNIDQHGIVMLENGNHLLMAYDPQLVGMDTVIEGGNPNATVIGFIIQELDSNHNVIFQWRSWDHFDILDGTHIDFTGTTIDYVHGNSIDITQDNQLLISCRGMDEVTKINRVTGEIIWRFGLHAVNNMFTFTNDTLGFSKQHDARQLQNGNVTVYDNGNFHTPQFSQGIEYQLNETLFTATMVWNYQHEPSIFGTATGSNHKKMDGNSLICWGLHWPTAFTEVDQDNNVQWELQYPDSIWNYQAFRQSWTTKLITTSTDTIDYGYFDDYIPWPVIVTVTNNANHEITINSASNHSEAFSLMTQLPQSLQPNETKNFIINFFPDGMGTQNFEDVMTLNYDSYYGDTLSRRIAQQITLKGTTINPSSIQLTSAPPINIFPNPTHNLIEIQSHETPIESITLYNLLGKKLKNIQVSTARTQVDLHTLPKGIYFVHVKLHNSDQLFTKKVVKQ